MVNIVKCGRRTVHAARSDVGRNVRNEGVDIMIHAAHVAHRRHETIETFAAKQKAVSSELNSLKILVGKTDVDAL